MSSPHRFVLKIEDGYTSWNLMCPDDGTCGPANTCSQCGRAYGDTEVEACYDCRGRTIDPDGCWAQTWVGEAMAEEVIRGTIEIEFPVHCQFNGDGLEAHVAGSAKALEQPSTAQSSGAIMDVPPTDTEPRH